jgi:hypothetical protein
MQSTFHFNLFSSQHTYDSRQQLFMFSSLSPATISLPAAISLPGGRFLLASPASLSLSHELFIFSLCSLWISLPKISFSCVSVSIISCFSIQMIHFHHFLYFQFLYFTSSLCIFYDVSTVHS